MSRYSAAAKGRSVSAGSVASLLCLALALAPCAALAEANAVAVIPIPQSLQSSRFKVTINGKPAALLNAAANYYELSLDLRGKARIAITAPDASYWAEGVDVQPWRENIRPIRHGATISFTLDHPAKLSITRPGDHLGGAEMIFLFANAPEHNPPSPHTGGIRYYAPGIYHEDIDARSGDRIYLAPGAIVFGSLNLWDVSDVQVSGRGTIIHDGPQDPDDDEGWMQRKNWHVISMNNARNVSVSGITCIVRSRTWMIQMRDSNHVRFDNIKVIGGSAGDANQDGMDWLGGGDTLVQDVFIRAADDIFAEQGNWDGYTEEALTRPGQAVNNITIENSVLSTSISNVVRVGWPKKMFNGYHFLLRDSDVIHMGMGSCGAPFALFEMWADPAGKGYHSDYRFEDIRLDDWYSLLQLRQPNFAISNVVLKNIWAMDGPGMVPSVLKGDVSGVTLEGVNLGGGVVASDKDVPLEVQGAAGEPKYQPSALDAGFDYSTGLLQPKVDVLFHAKGPATSTLHYRWLFGDGTSADGSTVHHAFPDADGTLLDGSGRFRVLLFVSSDGGDKAWSSRSVVVSSHPLPALQSAGSAPENQDLRETFDADLHVPADGGYTFTLLTSTTATLSIDDLPPARTAKLRPQVCGSPGDAVQPVRMSAAMRAGLHHIRITRGPELENAAPANGLSGAPTLFWEGPEVPQQVVPEGAWSSPR